MIKILVFKYINLLKYLLKNKFNFKSITYYPIKADIEPTTGCNFKCTMCQVSSPGFIKRNMSLETFKKIIDQNPQFIKIKIQGLGEPFVNKEIFEMIKYANDKFIKVNTVTNGSLLNSDNIKKILAVKINELSISIDGASKKVFESIRLGSDFDVVIKNVGNLTNNRNKNIKKIQSLTLIQKKNLFELEDIIKLCKRLKLDEIQFQYLLTSWGKDEWKTVNNEQQIDNENKFFDLIQIYRRKYQDNNFKIGVVTKNKFTEYNKCNYPWETPYFSTQGFVVPCCMIANPEVVNFGNITNMNFYSIWNNKQYDDLRLSINNHKLKDYCKNCYNI